MNAVNMMDYPKQRIVTLGSVMFRETITARMLRTLCDRGDMTQAEFMNLYHERCNRPRKDSRSSFGNNFGRFVGSELSHRGWIRVAGPLRCIAHVRPKFLMERESFMWNPKQRTDNLLRWEIRGCFGAGTLIQSLSNVDLQNGFSCMERLLTTPCDDHYDSAEIECWVKRLTAEINRRAS